MTACRNRRREAGFTLIELLITLALLSLLSLTLFGSLHYGTRVWDASQATAATADDVRAAQTRIADAIAEAYPKQIHEGIHSHVDFDGTASVLRVLARDPKLPGGFAHLTLRTRRVGGADDLIFERRAELAAPGVADDPPDVLVGPVRTVALRYYGREKPGAPLKWRESWSAKPYMPRLVRVQVVLANHRIAWPQLVVSPQIDADVSCGADGYSNGCEGG